MVAIRGKGGERKERRKKRKRNMRRSRGKIKIGSDPVHDLLLLPRIREHHVPVPVPDPDPDHLDVINAHSESKFFIVDYVF